MVCTDFSGKKPYGQVVFDSVIASGSLGGVIVNMLVQNVRGVGSKPAPDALIPIFITPTIVIKQNDLFQETMENIAI